jgi:hypothetical protein
MKYISTYFTSFTIVLFSIAIFNWFIDPFGMFWSPQIERINLIKTEAGKRSRITKAYQVNAIKPEILIVGNSRVEMGLNPKSKIFNDKIVYNQGMPGASVAMQVDYALDAIANNNTIEQLFVGVDFLDFLLSKKQVLNFKTKNDSHGQTKYDFRLISQDKSNLASIARLKEKLTMIFSLDAFSASINTIFQQKSKTSSINPLGFNNALSYVSIMNSEGIKPLFKQKLHEISTRLTSKQWVIKAQETAPYSPTFAHLGRLIKVAKEKQVDIVFFINPYHFSYLHTLADNSQWSNFQVWKKTLVNYLSIMQGDEFTLWDFSGESDFVNEGVPLANPKQQMQWFWEPAHYKKELGNSILFTLLREFPKHSFFGEKLTCNNIDPINAKEYSRLKEHSLEWKKLKKQLNL